MLLSLEEVLKKTADVAVEKMMKSGSLGAAFAVGFNADGKQSFYIIDMQFGVKHFTAAAVRATMLEEGVVQYGFANDAWLSPRAAAETPGLEPRHASDRIDVLAVLAATATRVLARTYRVHYNNTFPKITLSLFDQDADTEKGHVRGGRWATLLAPDFDPMGTTLIGHPESVKRARAAMARKQGG